MSDYGHRDNNAAKNVVVAGMWQSRNGHYHSLPVDAKGYDILQACFEQGGKFLIRKRTAEAIQNSRDPSKAPVAYLEFVPKAQVEEFNAKQVRTQSNVPQTTVETRGL